MYKRRDDVNRAVSLRAEDLHTTQLKRATEGVSGRHPVPLYGEKRRLKAPLMCVFTNGIRTLAVGEIVFVGAPGDIDGDLSLRYRREECICHIDELTESSERA